MHYEDTKYVWRTNVKHFFLYCRSFHLAESAVLIVGVVADVPDAPPDGHSALKDAKL